MSKRIITTKSPNKMAKPTVNNWLKKLTKSNALSVKAKVVEPVVRKSILFLVRDINIQEALFTFLVEEVIRVDFNIERYFVARFADFEVRIGNPYNNRKDTTFRLNIYHAFGAGGAVFLLIVFDLFFFYDASDFIHTMQNYYFYWFAIDLYDLRFCRHDKKSGFPKVWDKIYGNNKKAPL